MKEKLISKSTAKLAKEKGFNVPTFTNYCLSDETYRLQLFYGDEVSLNPGNNQGESWPVRYKLLDHNRSKKMEIYSAPSQSLLQKWLRDVYNTHLSIGTVYSEWDKWSFTVEIKGKGIIIPFRDYIENSYEEALEHGLREALKLIP